MASRYAGRKRKYGGSSSSSKRRKYGAVRRPFRKRRNFAYRRKGGGNGMRRLSRILPVYGRNALNMGYICPKIHIPYQLRTRKFDKSCFRAVGEPHYQRIKAVGATSGAISNSPCVYRFMPSLDIDTNYSFAKKSTSTQGWTSVTNNAWGTDNYGNLFVMSCKKILWSHTFLRIKLTNVNENQRIRLQFLKRRGGDPMNTNVLDAYNPDPDVPQGVNRWHVLYSKMFTFDKPKYTGTTAEASFTNNEIREVNYFFPWNRICRTYNDVQSDSISSWTGLTNPNDYMYLVITSDDATYGDGEYGNIEMHMEHKFYECN